MEPAPYRPLQLSQLGQITPMPRDLMLTTQSPHQLIHRADIPTHMIPVSSVISTQQPVPGGERVIIVMHDLSMSAVNGRNYRLAKGDRLKQVGNQYWRRVYKDGSEGDVIFDASTVQKLPMLPPRSPELIELD